MIKDLHKIFFYNPEIERVIDEKINYFIKKNNVYGLNVLLDSIDFIKKENKNKQIEGWIDNIDHKKSTDVLGFLLNQYDEKISINNQFFNTKIEIYKWLMQMDNQLDLKNVEIITDEGMLKVNILNKESVNLSSKKLKKMPIKFHHVNGNIFAQENQLSTLDFLPAHMYGSLFLNHNQIKGIDYFCKNFTGNLHLSNNPLESLENLDDAEIHTLALNHTKIKSFKGMPKNLKMNLFLRNTAIEDFDPFFPLNAKGVINLEETPMMNKYCHFFTFSSQNEENPKKMDFKKWLRIYYMEEAKKKVLNVWTFMRNHDKIKNKYLKGMS